jgi:high-affinity nickel-transport protein
MEVAPLGEVAAAEGGLALTLMVTVFLAGFRHGFDIDHVAAITDMASASQSRRSSLLLATTYALGHMLVVFALGVAAVFVGDSIPESWDAIAGRFIGLSLIWLGLYVAYSVIRYRHDFRMKSRWMLVVAGARRSLDTSSDSPVTGGTGSRWGVLIGWRGTY